MASTIYDYPLYYDVLFGWDRSGEAAFYDRIFELAGVDTGEPILEVAAGTGLVRQDARWSCCGAGEDEWRLLAEPRRCRGLERSMPAV